ncbi:MAG: UDP-glucose 4-epimerase GalE [Spirochaetes bacterium]|jgi:UDP-glucose 4-epimerase|nr:UDP-glucose 4-epimerase GalE [Spirochaetota bacterium]
MKVLVTGGAGYIGSTICSALEDSGHCPVILDNLITGRPEFTANRIFYKGDIADNNLLNNIFSDHPDIFCVIHCAALIIVPESTEKPYDYYHENVAKSLELFRFLSQEGCHRVVFSSSASIYDKTANFKVTEESPLAPGSPYARTKYMMEMVLQDFCQAYKLQGIALRYFNPIGADPKMRSGIHVKNPSHVMGKMVDVALGKDPVFKITGVNWPTRDGSGIRDYIHVYDLARAHVSAVEKFESAFLQSGQNDYLVINLGTGNGVTVKELVKAFETAYGQTITTQEAPPRPGDIAGAYANCDRAETLLKWKCTKNITEGIADALEWGRIRESRLNWS